MPDQPPPPHPQPVPFDRAVMGRVVEHDPIPTPANPQASSRTPHVMELVIMLVLIALVAWTCYLIYWPQIEGMILYMAGAGITPGTN